ncbi:C69 family dipeptidase [Lactobacillus psittaci]|uniref:Dipeptidase n=1 Tax=Lactobacillus psittaci DSM 15354 TaxID=1122152 RepID=A0A0R1SDH5_9LACO|nr:C69 family dipeptidase [Lactobacillus psittaci]KRL63291.1 dipeptidase [Lactobacillus psittaci DSM 15354]
MIIKHGRSACTSILIGKKASITGSVIIGRNEDCKTAWPKHLAFNPAKESQNSVFTSKDNKFSIPLPEKSYAYSSTPEWTDKYGVFEEDGINEFHVAMSATESAYANARVLAADPFDTENGILEEAMVTCVLPYIKTAREGIERLGEIIRTHGAAEADGILFADPNEAWYFEIGSGHHYVAQRIPDDSYAVVANQLAIQEIDFNDSNNFIYSAGLQDFVYNNNLWPKDKPFNWRHIFGTQDESDLHYNTPRVWTGQRLLTPSKQKNPQDYYLPFLEKPDRPISIQDAQRVLSDHYQNTPYDLVSEKNKHTATFRPISVATTQESHLLELNGDKMVHWLCMGVTSQGVYIPFYPQGTKVPEMWDKGTETYSADSAYWVFKLASILADRSWSKYAKELTSVQDDTSKQVCQIRYETDEKLATLSNQTEKQNLIDEANAKMAKVAIKNYQDLCASLITKQSAESPLAFVMDPNL